MKIIKNFLVYFTTKQDFAVRVLKTFSNAKTSKGKGLYLHVASSTFNTEKWTFLFKTYLRRMNWSRLFLDFLSFLLLELMDFHSKRKESYL